MALGLFHGPESAIDSLLIFEKICCFSSIFFCCKVAYLFVFSSVEYIRKRIVVDGLQLKTQKSSMIIAPITAYTFFLSFFLCFISKFVIGRIYKYTYWKKAAHIYQILYMQFSLCYLSAAPSILLAISNQTLFLVGYRTLNHKPHLFNTL